MISQEAIKTFVPWLLMILWAFRLRQNRNSASALASLYVVIFAGFSANFTFIYRELGQGFSVFCALLVFAGIFSRRTAPRYSIPLVVFFLFIALSLIDNRSALAFGATLNFISVSLVTVAVLGLLLTERGLKSFREAMIYCATVLSITAVVEVLGAGGRAEATFTNPNYLAFFLGVAGCIASLGSTGRCRWPVFIVICAGIFVTQSRAGMLFPIAALAGYAANVGLRRLAIIGPVLGGAFVALFLALSSSESQRDVEGSDAERYLAIEAGIQMTSDHLIAGVGWGRYLEEFWVANSRAPSLFPATEVVNVYSHRDMVSHNDFVRVFAELGVAGGLYFILLLAWSSRSIFRLPSELRYMFAAMLLGSLAFSLTHNNLNSSLFWIILMFPIAFTGAGRPIKTFHVTGAVG